MTNPPDARHDDLPDAKGVLFCPDCDHRSVAGGDWVVRADEKRREYRCPDCDASVLTQPLLGPEADPRLAAAEATSEGTDSAPETPDARWTGVLTRATATWSDWVGGLSLPVGLGGR